jgi:hypothetical protein
MWSILAQDVGVAAKKSYALIGARLFSLFSTNLKGKSSTQLAKEYARRRNDEEWHKKEMACKRDYKRRYRAENPGYVEHWNKFEREKYASNPRFKLKKLLSLWVYMKQDLKACMPKGYEDVRGFKQLAARKKELDDLGSIASRAASTADGVKG